MAETEEDGVIARIVQSMGEIPSAHWDACAGNSDPFLSHAFLLALEESGCVHNRTGWGPVHLLLDDPHGGAPAGCVPLYMKSHSRGEFIFDYGWADAYERAGGRYYPKLLSAVPFTPATGSRLLVRPDLDRVTTQRQLAAGLISAAEHLNIATISVNFLPEDEWDLLEDADYLKRADQQFHWYNRGYGSFDEFLDDLSSRKRKTIRRERRGALETGVEIELLSGSDLREEHWDAFYEFYTDTGSRKWGEPYLNRQFFSLITESMADKILLVMCRRQGRYIAGALNLIGGEALFGRYWGCIEDHPFLHFEVCYYQAIEYAIQHGLARVEAGAQGPHKIARGYRPTQTHSAHFIRDPGFRTAVANYLEHERAEVGNDIEYLAERGPFRKGERPALD
ncbi:MAG: N-acetyltransferase [Alphaproteobacteria bacterium]|nr:N-acetyltransferase [Alphaproteobacteria bacterium]